MMPSASPKQRVLIVGAKFGEMYLNALCSPPEGWNWSACWRGKRPFKRAGSCVWHSAVCLAGTDKSRMPDIACIVVRSTVAGGTGTQLARHFLTRGVHVIQEHPLTRMTSVPYKRWRRNRAAAIG